MKELIFGNNVIYDEKLFKFLLWFRLLSFKLSCKLKIHILIKTHSSYNVVWYKLIKGNDKVNRWPNSTFCILLKPKEWVIYFSTYLRFLRVKIVKNLLMKIHCKLKNIKRWAWVFLYFHVSRSLKLKIRLTRVWVVRPTNNYAPEPKIQKIILGSKRSFTLKL